MALSLYKSMKLNQPKNKSRPYLNSFVTRTERGVRQSLNATQKIQQKKQLVEWFKSRPELNSPVMARVNDTIKELEIFAVDGSTIGRNKRLEAEKWLSDNFFDERLKSIWTDSIITGEGFGWKGTLQESQVKSVVDNITESLSELNIDIKELRSQLTTKAMDEDARVVRKFDYVASSTMEIQHDERNINGYTQQVNANTQDFSVDEIVRFPFSIINGEVNGYTPVLSLAKELILIWFIKENMMAYMRNNGVPKKLFSLAEEQANSPNHLFLQSQLSDLGAVQNRHGNLVLTGKVDVQDLEETIKDMDYKELALYVTSNVAYALQIPVSRIPYMIGKAQSAGDAGGLAESGYWSMIEADQRRIENLLNTQIFNALGWKVVFKKQHKIDDVRETQALTMKADAIEKLQNIFAKYNKKMSSKKVMNMMGLASEDVEDLTPEEKAEAGEATGLRNQNLLNNQQLGNDDQVVKSDKARRAAKNNPKNVAQNGF